MAYAAQDATVTVGGSTFIVHGWDVIFSPPVPCKHGCGRTFENASKRHRHEAKRCKARPDRPKSRGTARITDCGLIRKKHRPGKGHNALGRKMAMAPEIAVVRQGVLQWV